MRKLGQTGLAVSAVGLGAGQIGGPETTDADVDHLLGRARDLGVNLIDTARSYGASEERLGRALAGRRDAFVVSTKLGYGVPGVPDWTPECIRLGVDSALARLRTDRLDIVHLHSCDRHTLQNGGVVEALNDAVLAGKVRVAAYSGENDALAWALHSGAFAVVQCSVSPVDQTAPIAETALGVLAKRPLGNAPWRYRERPPEDDRAEAWERFRTLALEESVPWAELFARYSAHAPGVSAILVGTARAEHLAEVVTAVTKGPLPPESLNAIRDAWRQWGGHWHGRI